MVDAGSVFGSLAGLPHFPMSFTSISADFGLSIVTGAFFVPLMNFERERGYGWDILCHRNGGVTRRKLLVFET